MNIVFNRSTHYNNHMYTQLHDNHMTVTAGQTPDGAEGRGLSSSSSRCSSSGGTIGEGGGGDCLICWRWPLLGLRRFLLGGGLLNCRSKGEVMWTSCDANCSEAFSARTSSYNNVINRFSGCGLTTDFLFLEKDESNAHSTLAVRLYENNATPL